jgi:outer membrane protein assembly factor BamB
VRRALVVVVALVAAMAFAAALARSRTRGGRRTASGVVATPRQKAPQPALVGLGAGPPPMLAEGPPGVLTLHGDARRTHRARGRAPRSMPRVGWSRDAGGPVEAQVATSPDEQTLYVASLGGKLSALAREDGAPKWELDLGERVYATPCVASDGTIFVGTDARKFLAVSPEGKVKWSLQTDGDADTGPVVADGDGIVFAAGRMVYAVTPLGYVKWRFGAKRKVFTAPAIGAHGRVFFGSQDHRVYALAPDGTLVWSLDLGFDVDGAPAVGDDGSVFVGTDGDEVVRVDADDGHVVWRSKLGGYVRGTLSIARNGDVFAGVYGPAPRAVRLRSEDGSVRGDFPIQGTGAREFGVHGGGLEDATGVVLFGAQDDAVYAIDENGKLLWRFTTEGDVDAPITLLGDGAVVVASDDGQVRLLVGASP